MQTSVAAHVLAADPERLDRTTVAKALDDIADTCRTARGELRTTLEVLRDNAGPADARGPLAGLDGVPDLVEAARLAGARVEPAVRVEGPVRPAVGAAAYRLVQEAPCSRPAPTARLIERFLRSPSAPVAAGPECLSDREREVLTLVARGLNNTEIAGSLGLSPLTVKTHVSRTMGKLGVRDRAQLVIVAYESGLVAPGRS